MIFCYGTFVKILNLCKTGKRSPTQKELHNRILSSVYEPYTSAGIADDASTNLLQCKQGLSEYVIRDTRRIIDNGEVKKIAEHFQKKIIEAHLLKNDSKTKHALVSALINIISNDTSISENTVVELVNCITKKDLIVQKKYILSEFLAGIFLYTVVAVDNRSGRESCQEINESFFDRFYNEDCHLFITEETMESLEKNTINERNSSLGEHNFSEIEQKNELPLEFEKKICMCNSTLSKAQNRVRVYSWDELDFSSIYVVPFLARTPNSEEKQSAFLDSTKLNEDYLIEEEKGHFKAIAESVEKEIIEPENIESPKVVSNNAINIFPRLVWTDLRFSEIEPISFKLDELIHFLNGDFEIQNQKREVSIAERKEVIRDIFEDDDIIYVVGGAGYGKSLFLKNLCVNPDILAGVTQKPRLVIRGDIKRLIRSDGTFRPMDEFLEECFTNGSLRGSGDFYLDFLRKCLDAGRCLVLLDALDEVGNDQRNELHNLIISYFEDTYPENKVCITSRERGFIPREYITCFYIRPITLYDVKEYIERFIKLNKFAVQEKERFLNQAANLVERGFIKGFLTLSLLLAIYKNEEELPTNKLLLYEKCFEYIATTREKSKRLLRNSSTGEEYDWKNLGKFMTDATFIELARLGTPNNKDIPEREINELMLDLYKNRFDSDAECRMSTEMFLHFCSDRTEIFVPSPNSNIEYRFFHRSFYEYFCAKYIEIRTRSVDETYRKLMDFDIDSEIFELIVTLYERRDPHYLRELVLKVFQCAEEEIRSCRIDSRGVDILVMIMQVVDDKDFLHRFIKLFLTEGDSISRLSLSVNFGMINDVLRRDADFMEQQISNKDQTILAKIKDVLIKFLLTQKECCDEILRMVKQKKQKDTTIDDINLQKGFSYLKLLIFFSDFHMRMEEYFKKFAERNYLITKERLSFREINRIVSFVDRVNALSWKERIYVYNEIIMRS